jgi:hypothetical protein
MAGPVGSGSVFRFGVFELDLRAGELRKRGIRIKIQEQPIEILGLLLECPGEVVTREQIQNKLWNGDTFVDFDNAINGSIRKVRDALGDNSENPVFVFAVAVSKLQSSSLDLAPRPYAPRGLLARSPEWVVNSVKTSNSKRHKSSNSRTLSQNRGRVTPSDTTAE